MKGFMLRRMVLPGTLMVLASTAATAAKSADFAYAWPLTVSGDSSAYQIEITPKVYAVLVDPALRDLEVFNAADEAVPLQAIAFDTQILYHEERVNLPIFALPRDAGDSASDDLHIRIERDTAGHLRQLDTQTGNARSDSTRTDYLLDASAIETAIESLWLQDTMALNAQFGVDSSDDLQHWRSVIDAASVMDLRQGDATLLRRQMALPQIHAKYLRLRRLDNGAAPSAGFSIEARLLSRTSVQRPARSWIDVPLTAQELAADAVAAGVSRPKVPIGYVYSLPGALNVEALRLTLASDNSIAEISAFSRLDGGTNTPPWNLRTHFTAFRLRQDGALLSNDEIPIGTSPRTRLWRIESAQPLNVPASLSIAYRPDRFVFLAQGAAPYRLVAGQRSERRADAPVGAALEQLRSRLGHDWQPPLVTLGARETLRGAAAIEPTPIADVYPWKSWLLWALLVGGAAAVGFMALQLLKDARPPKP